VKTDTLYLFAHYASIVKFIKSNQNLFNKRTTRTLTLQYNQYAVYTINLTEVKLFKLQPFLRSSFVLTKLRCLESASSD